MTPPTGQTFYDPRSRASTLTESSPPLQPIQKDIRVPQHYLTPPAEGQSSPAALALSQSLPVSRRNSNTDQGARVGQDLSIIYENAPAKYGPPVELTDDSTIHGSDHRKSSGTLSGTWSNASGDGTYVGSTKGYDDIVEQRSDSMPSKNVFGMLKTQDGQFPFLSSLLDTVCPRCYMPPFLIMRTRVSRCLFLLGGWPDIPRPRHGPPLHLSSLEIMLLDLPTQTNSIQEVFLSRLSTAPSLNGRLRIPLRIPTCSALLPRVIVQDVSI